MTASEQQKETAAAAADETKAILDAIKARE